MIKFLNILSDVITEGKRFQFDPEVYLQITNVVDKLWNDRNKTYTKKTLVDKIPFKSVEGVDGLAKIIVNPRLKYIGYMGTKPKKSLDPADIYLEVNPKHYETKKNLYLTVYHEMLHAADPTQSYKWTPSYELTYDEKSDEKYWGHPIEFFAISNEFLEGLVLEFERRIDSVFKPKNIMVLEKSLKNILNYFAKGERLSSLSRDILHKINDENLEDETFSKTFHRMTDEFPEMRSFMKKETPYYLHYVEMIKKYNPEIWPKFLNMLYKTYEEIQTYIDNKKGV